MPADDGWNTVTHSVTAHQARPSWSNRPQLSVMDMLVMLWRAKWAIAAIALPILALSILVAFTLPVKYEAASRIQVTAGVERVFDPIAGGVQGQVLGQEEITESEIDLLYSPEIADRVIQAIGLGVIYPKAQAAMDRAPAADRPVMYERALKSFQEDFYATSRPKNPVIQIGYANEDPLVAADVLNTLMDVYLDYRSEIFLDQGEGVLGQQREITAEKLDQADSAIQLFLTTNRIGDFDTEKSSVAGLYANVTDQLFNVQAQKSEVGGRLAALNAQLALTAPTIDLYVETNYEQQLLDLKIEREQLLGIYLPSTPQVQALDRRIEKVEALINGGGRGTGVKRTGPNEVYQTLDTRRVELEAEHQALKVRFEELQRQKQEIERRQLQLTRLEPQYQDLLRDRAILENQVRNLSVREQDQRITREVTKADFENIQILERARPPAEGQSLRKVVAILGLLFGGFTGLVFALIWIFTRSTLPTPSSVTQTTGLPVLATVRSMR